MLKKLSGTYQRMLTIPKGSRQNFYPKIMSGTQMKDVKLGL